MLLEIDNVELTYSNTPVLKGIYLKAETGKITGILGPNGCGKSSLLKVLFGNVKADHKLIRIDNKPYLKPLYSYGIVKYLPQGSFIPGHLKLKTVFKLFEVSWSEFTGEFKDFLLYKEYTIKELSGGERRLMEAYLIVKSESQILLLDEPFTHLSPVYIEKFTKILKKESTKKAIIVTDHLFHHIIDLADTLYFIKSGCTRLIQDPKELENLEYLSMGTL